MTIIKRDRVLKNKNNHNNKTIVYKKTMNERKNHWNKAELT